MDRFALFVRVNVGCGLDVGVAHPSIYEVCGWGEVDGLEGANCRHHHFPFVVGVSKRTYTDEQLENIDPQPFEYQGRTYTAYEATQKQRQIETAMRKCKREIIGYKSAGLENDAQDASIKLGRLSREYKSFSNAAGIRTQPERSMVQGYGSKEAGYTAKTIAKYSRVRYHEDGSVVVTDDRTAESHPRIEARYLTNAVVDHLSQNGKQRNRTFYDSNGLQIKQISNGPHGNHKKHPYGENGEHAHDVVWENGKIISRSIRGLTENERKENADIL